MRKQQNLLNARIAALSVGCFGKQALAQDREYSSNQVKPASASTIAAQQQLRAMLPFNDTADFDEAKKGFIAAPDFRRIDNDDGGVAWNMDDWKFLLTGQQYDSINPS